MRPQRKAHSGGCRDSRRLARAIVFFRDKNIAPEEHIACAERCGAIHHHPFMKGIEQHP